MLNTLKKLEIIQNNITSLRPIDTRETLKNFLLKNKTDIVILSEIWLKKDEHYKFPGYKLLTETRAAGYGGVGFLVKNEIEFKSHKLPKLHPIESIAIVTQNTQPKILFISIYIPPLPVNNNDIKEPFKKLLDTIDDFNGSVILAGDFNAHNQLWNPSHENCPRGELLEHLLDNRNLVLLNDGSSTLIKAPNTIPSAIDLTFATPELASKIDWKVTEEDFFSNHRVIHFNIDSTAYNYKYKHDFFNKNQAIQKLNTLQPHAFHTPEDISEIVQEIVQDCTYKINSNKNINPKSWWTNQIKVMLDEKNSKFRDFLRNQTDQNFTEFKKSRAILKREIRREKRKSWKKMIDSIDNTMDNKTLWNTVRIVSGGRPAKNNLNLLNNNSLSQQFMNLNFPPITDRITFTQKPGKEIEVNYTEISKIIKSKKDHSTPGIDKLSFFILKNIKFNLIIRFTELMQEVLNTGRIPKDWRTINIIPLLKPTKEPDKPQSYRPLAMINVLIKLINNVVKNKLNDFLKDNNVIPLNSYGFKKHTSAINCVNTLISKIYEAKREGMVLAATFLDLTKAFDNVNVSKLLSIMEHLRIPSEIVNWVYNYLKERKMILELNDGTRIVQTTNKGLPQGCPLSPILFNIYTHIIHQVIRNDEILIQFADDFTAVVTGFSVATVAEKMNIFLTRLSLEFEKLGMEINPLKSATIVFKNKFDPSINIRINNSIIPVVPNHRILGVHLDHKLSFKTHINNSIIKAKNKINILKMISRKRSGAHPEQMLKIYKAIVRPHIEYGLTIIGIVCKTTFKKLETVQNLAIRTSLRYLQSTPNHVILCESGEIPLKKRAEMLALKEISKTLFHRNSPIVESLYAIMNLDHLPKHISFLEKTASLNNYLLLQLLPKLTPVHDNRSNNRITIRNNIKEIKKKNINTNTQKQIVLDLIDNYYKNCYQIYTDGSISNTLVGCGFYDAQEKISYSSKLRTGYTILSAEIVAIINAVNYAKNKNIDNIAILTDSKNACTLLLKPMETDNSLIVKLWNEIQQTDFSKIYIQWIPGHINIIGNDRADYAAKMGTTKTTEEQIGYSLPDLLNIFKNETNKEWQEQYELISTEKGKFHYEHSKTISNTPWFKGLNLTTIEVIQIGRIRTGHVVTKEKLANWNLVSNSRCDHCGNTEDLSHILYHCPKYNLNRTNTPILNNNTPLINILQKNDPREHKQIVEYLRKIDKYV